MKRRREGIAELDQASRLVLDALAGAATHGPASPGADPALGERLLDRALRSVRAASAFHTVRGGCAWVAAEGARWVELYRATSGVLRRAGEPLRVRQFELAPGACIELSLQGAGVRCEWLVMSGDARIDGLALTALDYHVAAAAGATATLSSLGGARIYLREAQAVEGGAPYTVRHRDTSWPAYAPGIERRVLWQHRREAALLYRVQPGAAVPAHGHCHDEECLMVEGDAFVDDILLRSGEYQLAPAGTRHRGVASDTGGILFAHGDIELDLAAP